MPCTVPTGNGSEVVDVRLWRWDRGMARFIAGPHMGQAVRLESGVWTLASGKEQGPEGPRSSLFPVDDVLSGYREAT